jgi:hypothetical protein
MANWTQLKSYIHNTYNATELSPRAIQLTFTLDGGRNTQATYVSFAEGPQGDHWAQLDSPIGPLDQLDIVRALTLVENVVCGGLCHVFIQGVHHLSIRHCLPLENMDTNEFETPLQFVTLAANGLRQELSAGTTSTSEFNRM